MAYEGGGGGGEGPLGGLELELGPSSPKAWQELLRGTVRSSQESRAPTSATPFLYHILCGSPSLSLSPSADF